MNNIFYFIFDKNRLHCIMETRKPSKEWQITQKLGQRKPKNNKD
jgi:hypothetical protein